MVHVPTPEQCEMVSGILKVLSHPQRLMILCLLSQGPKTVSELEHASGAAQSSVSQFLARMKAEKLVNSKRHASHVYYEVADPRIFKLVQSMHKIFLNSPRQL